jgi:hypothetical protein
MARMSASNLIARTARDVGETASEVDVAPQLRAATAETAAPVVRRAAQRALIARNACNPRLASCRKFAAMRAHVAQMGRHVAKLAPSRAARLLAVSRKTTAETRRRGAGA